MSQVQVQRFNTDMQYVESSREHTTLWWFHNNLYFYPPSYDSTSLHFSLFFNNKCNIYTQFFCCYYYKKKRISLKSLDEICACWCAARDQTVHRYNDIKKSLCFTLFLLGYLGVPQCWTEMIRPPTVVICMFVSACF